MASLCGSHLTRATDPLDVYVQDIFVESALFGSKNRRPNKKTKLIDSLEKCAEPDSFQTRAARMFRDLKNACSTNMPNLDQLLNFFIRKQKAVPNMNVEDLAMLNKLVNDCIKSGGIKVPPVGTPCFLHWFFKGILETQNHKGIAKYKSHNSFLQLKHVFLKCVRNELRSLTADEASDYQPVYGGLDLQSETVVGFFAHCVPSSQEREAVDALNMDNLVYLCLEQLLSCSQTWGVPIQDDIMAFLLSDPEIAQRVASRTAKYIGESGYKSLPSRFDPRFAKPMSIGHRERDIDTSSGSELIDVIPSRRHDHDATLNVTATLAGAEERQQVAAIDELTALFSGTRSCEEGPRKTFSIGRDRANVSVIEAEDPEEEVRSKVMLHIIHDVQDHPYIDVGTPAFDSMPVAARFSTILAHGVTELPHSVTSYGLPMVFKAVYDQVLHEGVPVLHNIFRETVSSCFRKGSANVVTVFSSLVLGNPYFRSIEIVPSDYYRLVYGLYRICDSYLGNMGIGDEQKWTLGIENFPEFDVGNEVYKKELENPFWIKKLQLVLDHVESSVKSLRLDGFTEENLRSILDNGGDTVRFFEGDVLASHAAALISLRLLSEIREDVQLMMEQGVQSLEGPLRKYDLLSQEGSSNMPSEIPRVTDSGSNLGPPETKGDAFKPDYADIITPVIAPAKLKIDYKDLVKGNAITTVPDKAPVPVPKVSASPDERGRSQQRGLSRTRGERSSSVPPRTRENPTQPFAQRQAPALSSWTSAQNVNLGSRIYCSNCGRLGHVQEECFVSREVSCVDAVCNTCNHRHERFDGGVCPASNPVNEASAQDSGVSAKAAKYPPSDQSSQRGSEVPAPQFSSTPGNNTRLPDPPVVAHAPLEPEIRVIPDLRDMESGPSEHSSRTRSLHGHELTITESSESGGVSNPVVVGAPQPNVEVTPMVKSNKSVRYADQQVPEKEKMHSESEKAEVVSFVRKGPLKMVDLSMARDPSQERIDNPFSAENMKKLTSTAMKKPSNQTAPQSPNMSRIAPQESATIGQQNMNQSEAKPAQNVSQPQETQSLYVTATEHGNGHQQGGQQGGQVPNQGNQTHYVTASGTLNDGRSVFISGSGNVGGTGGGEPPKRPMVASGGAGDGPNGYCTFCGRPGHPLGRCVNRYGGNAPCNQCAICYPNGPVYVPADPILPSGGNRGDFNAMNPGVPREIPERPIDNSFANMDELNQELGQFQINRESQIWDRQQAARIGQPLNPDQYQPQQQNSLPPPAPQVHGVQAQPVPSAPSQNSLPTASQLQNALQVTLPNAPAPVQQPVPSSSNPFINQVPASQNPQVQAPHVQHPAYGQQAPSTHQSDFYHNRNSTFANPGQQQYQPQADVNPQPQGNPQYGNAGNPNHAPGGANAFPSNNQCYGGMPGYFPNASQEQGQQQPGFTGAQPGFQQQGPAQPQYQYQQQQPQNVSQNVSGAQAKPQDLSYFDMWNTVPRTNMGMNSLKLDDNLSPPVFGNNSARPQGSVSFHKMLGGGKYYKHGHPSNTVSTAVLVRAIKQVVNEEHLTQEATKFLIYSILTKDGQLNFLQEMASSNEDLETWWIRQARRCKDEELGKGQTETQFRKLVSNLPAKDNLSHLCDDIYRCAVSIITKQDEDYGNVDKNRIINDAVSKSYRGLCKLCKLHLGPFWRTVVFIPSIPSGEVMTYRQYISLGDVICEYLAKTCYREDGTPSKFFKYTEDGNCIEAEGDEKRELAASLGFASKTKTPKTAAINALSFQGAHVNALDHGGRQETSQRQPMQKENHYREPRNNTGNFNPGRADEPPPSYNQIQQGPNNQGGNPQPPRYNNGPRDNNNQFNNGRGNGNDNRNYPQPRYHDTQQFRGNSAPPFPPQQQMNTNYPGGQNLQMNTNYPGGQNTGAQNNFRPRGNYNNGKQYPGNQDTNIRTAGKKSAVVERMIYLATQTPSQMKGDLCLNCAKLQHFWGTCFPYECAEPGDKQCPTCSGFHKGPCIGFNLPTDANLDNYRPDLRTAPRPEDYLNDWRYLAILKKVPMNDGRNKYGFSPNKHVHVANVFRHNNLAPLYLDPQGNLYQSPLPNMNGPQ